MNTRELSADRTRRHRAAGAPVWPASLPALDVDERELLVENRPRLFYFTDHYRDHPIVLLRLSNAQRADVEPLLRRQWRALTSKKALAAIDRG